LKTGEPDAALELPLAPFVSTFNLSSWLGSLTVISFCSPLPFMV